MNWQEGGERYLQRCGCEAQSQPGFPTLPPGPCFLPILASRGAVRPKPQGTARADSGEGALPVRRQAVGLSMVLKPTKVYSRATIKVSQAAARSCWRSISMCSKGNKKECQRKGDVQETVRSSRVLFINICLPKSKGTKFKKTFSSLV